MTWSRRLSPPSVVRCELISHTIVFPHTQTFYMPGHHPFGHNKQAWRQASGKKGEGEFFRVLEFSTGLAEFPTTLLNSQNIKQFLIYY